MKSLLHVVVAGVLLVAALPALSQRNLAVQPTEQRVALVIGNASYKNSPLRNPVNDARAIAERLQKLGFVVIKRENMTARQIGPALREFRSRLSAGSTALFFYAGHGLQVKGINYLPTVDAEIEAEEDVPTQALDVAKVLELMDEAKSRVNLVFLDACRDNPFARKFRGGSRGLAKVDAASGTLISFATRPGSVAADGEGQNGLYTEYLLKHMETPALPVEQMLKRVGAEVKLASKGKQEPWSEGLIEGDFYFRAAGSVASMTNAPAEPPRIQSAAEVEQQLWDAVKDSRDARDFQDYLATYPSGRFAAVARARLRALEAPQQNPASAPQPVALAAPSSLKFNRDPATGTEIAVVRGNPGGQGPYVMRVRSQAGWKSMPHRHPNDIHVTVVSGVMRFAEGEQFDESRFRDYPAGSSLVIRANVAHYDFSPVVSELQVEGSGPLRTISVKP